MIEYNNVGKVAFLGDVHFGLKNDSPVFLDHMINFFEKDFFPWLIENDIKHVIQFGDFMDRRKSVNFVTLSTIRERFFKFFDDNNIKMHILLGNHDVYYKSTNRINAIKELFSKNVILYDKPTNISLDGVKFLILPWITKDNQEEIERFIEETDADYCLSHLELAGFEFTKGIMSYHGTESNIFTKFKHVWSGHYHTSSTKGNITYLGTPYEMTWADYNDTKKVYQFTLDTRELEAVSMNKRMFCYVDWNEDLSNEWLDTGKINMAKRYNVDQGCSFKITVDDEKWDLQVDNFVRWLDKKWKPIKIAVIDLYNIISEDVDLDSLEAYNTIDLMYKSVSELPRSSQLIQIVKELYDEALIEQANE